MLIHLQTGRATSSLASSPSSLQLSLPRSAPRCPWLAPSIYGQLKPEARDLAGSLASWLLGGVPLLGQRFVPVSSTSLIYRATSLMSLLEGNTQGAVNYMLSVCLVYMHLNLRATSNVVCRKSWSSIPISPRMHQVSSSELSNGSAPNSCWLWPASGTCYHVSHEPCTPTHHEPFPEPDLIFHLARNQLDTSNGSSHSPAASSSSTSS